MIHDVCDVTLSVYPHRASLKNMPANGGNRTYDLWNTSPMLCQLGKKIMNLKMLTKLMAHSPVHNTSNKYTNKLFHNLYIYKFYIILISM
jgi:hypothetical protein